MIKKNRIVNTVVCHECGKEFPAGDTVCPWCHTENVGNEASQREWETKGTFWIRFRWFLLLMVVFIGGFFGAVASGSLIGFLIWIAAIIVFDRIFEKQPFRVRDREKQQEEKRLRKTRKYAQPVKSMIVTSSSRTSVSSAVGRGIVGGVLGGGVGAIAGVMSGKKKETVTFQVWWSDNHQTTEQVKIGSIDYQRFMNVLK